MKWRNLIGAVLILLVLWGCSPRPSTLPSPPESPKPKPSDIFISGMAGPNVLRPFQQAGFISQSHATIIGVGADAAFGTSSSSEKMYRTSTSEAHAEGLKWTIWLPAYGSREINLISKPELKANCIDIDGNKIINGGSGQYWQCTNSPDWREYLKEVAERSIDWGADGIAIDEPTGTFGSLQEPYNGCFCENCMLGFREYLKKKYSVDELRSFGIDDIDNFDYGRFIKEKYLTQYKSDRWNMPLFQDFQDYQMKSAVNFWHEFIIELKEYARAQGKQIYFSANTAGLLPPDLPIETDLDYLSPEIAFSYPPGGRSIPIYKIASSLGTFAFTNPQSGADGLDLMVRPDMTTLMKIYTAEAFSARGSLIVPYSLPIANPEPTWCSANMDELKPYYDFIHDRSQYYNNLVSTSKIAVLYAFPSARWDYLSFRDSFYGICNLLLDTHFQYDVLFAGDDDWIQDSLSLEALKKYDVVVLPNTSCLSDKQVNLLLSYAESGGRVVGFGDIGIRDEKGLDVRRDQLKSLLIKGVSSYGSGEIAYIGGDPGADYINSRPSSTREEFSKLLNELTQSNILTNANENVAMLEYYNGETGSLVIHLINYAYDINTQRLSSQNDIDLDVVLPEQLLGKDLTIYYSSPDWVDTAQLKFEQSTGSVSFQVPKLDFYGVVEIAQRHQ